MKTRIDNNGNIHIPKIMKDNLGIKKGQQVNIECSRDKIIITNDKKMRTRDEIKSFIADLKDFDDDVTKGMKAMADWVLYEDYTGDDENEN